VLAILYFALMELMLIDSTRALKEAQRYRARVVAHANAESGAELAAVDLVTSPGATATAKNAQGTMSGKLVRTSLEKFELTGEGIASGLVTDQASVVVQGRVLGTRVVIDYAVDSQ
jgi:hypothetical protein